jgi:membrane protease YdiL (CAAX protease family)
MPYGRESWVAQGGWRFALGVAVLAVGLLANSLMEELLRAYVIRRTFDAWGSLGWAMVLSVAAFVAYHVHYANLGLVPLGIHGVLLAAYFTARANVAAMTIAHTLYNAVVIGLAVRFGYPE